MRYLLALCIVATACQVGPGSTMAYGLFPTHLSPTAKVLKCPYSDIKGRNYFHFRNSDPRLTMVIQLRGIGKKGKIIDSTGNIIPVGKAFMLTISGGGYIRDLQAWFMDEYGRYVGPFYTFVYEKKPKPNPHCFSIDNDHGIKAYFK